MPYRSTPVAGALPPAVRRVVAAFLRHLRLARSSGVRHVHEARVASRRLREVLPVALDDDGAELRREIRRLARAMGRVRELDVSLGLLASPTIREHWPPPTLARVERELTRDRGRAQDAMAKRIARVDVTALGRELRALARVVAVPAHAADVDSRLMARRRARARALRDALEDVGTVYAPSSLHEVRIAAKKLRYSLEWTQTAVGPVVRTQMAELRAAQQVLGEIQDLHTLQARIRRMAAGRPIDRSTVRALNAGSLRIEAVGRQLHAQFVALTPRLLALATDLTRKTPLAWIRRRPVRMAGGSGAVGPSQGAATRALAGGSKPPSPAA
jgi:CHAD domain-containing protein